METRNSASVTRGVLAIAWLGMAGFVGFHSFLLLSRSLGDPAVASFRTAWFAGFAVVAAMLIYFGVRDRSLVTEGSTTNENPTAGTDSTTSDE